ncbi:MAG: DUF1385 domain-containing protein [Thermodesulfovibrionales bacterium]
MKNIGGQAVIEGVMMKSPRGWTVAVRDPRGAIQVKREPLGDLPSFLRLPVVRGVGALYHALSLGIRAIDYSARTAFEGAEGDKPMSRTAMALTIGFALIMGVGLFILLPLYLTKLLGAAMARVGESSLWFNLVDGLIRVAVFLLYVVAIGLWKDMRRVFEYHGAEHKVIHAYEEGMELSVENARRLSPLHPRCGTSFLLIVMVTSILVFSFVPQPWPFLYKFLARLVLIPLIAGLSFEFLKFTARRKENPLVALAALPGLALQRLTTREPDDAQIQVAIRALSEVLSMEEEAGNA